MKHNTQSSYVHVSIDSNTIIYLCPFSSFCSRNRDVDLRASSADTATNLFYANLIPSRHNLRRPVGIGQICINLV